MHKGGASSAADAAGFQHFWEAECWDEQWEEGQAGEEVQRQELAN